VKPAGTGIGLGAIAGRTNSLASDTPKTRNALVPTSPSGARDGTDWQWQQGDDLILMGRTTQLRFTWKSGEARPNPFSNEHCLANGLLLTWHKGGRVTWITERRGEDQDEKRRALLQAMQFHLELMILAGMAIVNDR
jgi:hypothetical protein